MAKRFTDTDKWKKTFIRSMKAPYKLLWLYILDECDHAGIWHVDVEVAQIKIGEKIRLETALQVFKNKIIEFDEGNKWFIPDFISFQYGELNPANRAHNSVIQLLNKYNLLIDNKPLTSPLQGAMDMDKDKEQDMDMDMDKDNKGKPKIEIVVYPFGELFLNTWNIWKNYKKTEHGFKYKTAQSEQAAINKLVELANGLEDKAILIIRESLANGWQGLFEIKTPTNGSRQFTNAANNHGIDSEQFNAAHAKYFGS